MSRSIVKLIHADNFFPGDDAMHYRNAVLDLQYTEAEYGLEIPNFNMIPLGLEPVFSKVLGEPVVLDRERSGVFRRPMNCIIHFEGFDSLNEWCFLVALERTTFNLYHHLSGATSALDGYKFNYRNLFEWDYDVNIILQPNQGVFFRPWLFHSIEDGLVQYYKLLTTSTPTEDNLKVA
jgi:hypothetical protein